MEEGIIELLQARDTALADLGLETVREWTLWLTEVERWLMPHFARREARHHAWAHIRGLLSPVERKNGWQLAEVNGDATPYGLQPPQLFPTGRSEALAPGNPLTLYRTPSCTACPGGALPRHAWLRATCAGRRGVLEAPPARRAGSGCRRRVRGRRRQRRGKRPFGLPIRPSVPYLSLRPEGSWSTVCLLPLEQ